MKLLSLSPSQAKLESSQVQHVLYTTVIQSASHQHRKSFVSLNRQESVLHQIHTSKK